MNYALTIKPQTSWAKQTEAFMVGFTVGLVQFGFAIDKADAEAISNLMKVDKGGYLFEMMDENGWCGIVRKDGDMLELQISSVGSVTLRDGMARVIVDSIVEAYNAQVALAV